MTQVLIVAHYPLASALEAVARHVYPDCAARLRVVDIEAHLTMEQATDKVEAVLAEARASAPGVEGREALILVDTQGATPGRAARRAAHDPGVRVVAGVNVPMLWRTLCYVDEPLDDLVARALEGAGRGVSEILPEG